MRNFRQILAASAAAALALGLSACSSSADKADSTNGADASGIVTLKVGASPSPHAKILKYVDENLAAEAGIDLDIVEYTDYIQPNEALKSGDLDANFFQTVPYLEQQAEENGYEFTAGKGIHLEPLAVYSEKLKSLDQLPEGATIGIIDDVTNQSRALALLAEQGLVTLPTDGSDANVHTVTKVKKFEFKEVQGPQLVRSLADVDVAVINGNFAQEGGLSPKDAIVVESPENNPAVNILAWANNTNKLDAVKKLEDLLHSDQVKQYIEQTWSDDSVIPAF
ncbi:methionine ABC superfamily ATP binding cassette transporter, binding protein [Schaalia cardiffensis F0333]|uniref:Lipoprotein n=1 Tax=Schaalia cardiffensis F0333 TaxID=888050 RepID=N6XAM0_9ACTO|nr:MetQ/NlpA family ABC transporter substrate-binding protein [Schaalia cardiffensis]ENO18188.1 methionine ABC superfamily ATP binding cassette transporter, binding protein [Schaalia cardiffensis F0333]